jgi:signal transduction histidine kinase/CheY-like chemotaxis protein
MRHVAIGSKSAEFLKHFRAIRPIRIVILIGLAAIIALCVGMAWFILQLRFREIQDAKRELVTLDILLMEESERALQSVDLVLRSVQEKIAADNITTPEAFERTQSSHDRHELLSAKITGIPQTEALAIIGADGHVISASRDDLTLPQDVSHSDYFLSLRDETEDVAFLGELVQSHNRGTWSIFLARRVSALDGTFLGVIVSSIGIDYFTNLFKALDIGEGAAVSLWRKDGTLLARYPLLAGPTQIYRSKIFEKRKRFTTPQTFFVEQSKIDGYNRLVATVAGKQFPIVVNVGYAVDTILQDWRRISTLAIAVAMLFFAAIIFILWLLTRQFLAFEALRVAVNQSAAADAARIKAEEQLRQAQKLEAIGELTGGIAHDFNNLLTAVIGNLDLLSRHAEDVNPRLMRWAGSALDAAKRGATLTQRLLAYSRRAPLEPKPTDIVELLNSMFDLLRRTLGENIEIQTVVAAELWPAFVDSNQLDSAILNIAINARDAMDGSGQLLIDVRNMSVARGEFNGRFQDREGDYVMISLRDNGKGMNEDILGRVFEPFFTTKPTGQGTGLGLSQVYGFLKQTGGQIIIESEPGQWTNVKLFLPRATVVEEVPALEQPLGSTHLDAGIIILVVEDDAEVRAFTVESLKGLGAEVREARDALEALDLLRQDPAIHFLLTDVGLPGMNGGELARRVALMRPDVKTLFTSGYARQALMHNDRLDEGVQLLVKPFTREQLAQKIRLVLDQAPRRAAS